MKYYKDNQNNVFAYESDGSQDYLIGSKTAMTATEVEAHINKSSLDKPILITPLQARLALNEMGIRPSIEASIVNASQDVKDFYEFALEWNRDNIHLIAMATSLDMDSVAIDNFFLLASKK